MELTPFNWLALSIAVFIVGLLLGRFLFPQCPKEIPLGGSGVVPASGGTLRFRDHDRQIYVIEVPQQKFPVGLTFTSSEPKKPEEVPNPTRKKIYRTLIKLDVTDENGRTVDHFDPAIKTTAKYLPRDLDSAKGDLEKDINDAHYKDDPLVRAVKADPKLKDDPNFLAKYLILFYHDGEAWRRLAMLPGSRDTQAMTLTAYIASFSGSGIGGDS